ncbi:hypothetical protein E6R60_33530 [Streptomyces sp. A0642]|nr:hypothetical protein E6R60_33530 [Streptomyces sp. A0642]
MRWWRKPGTGARRSASPSRAPVRAAARTARRAWPRRVRRAGGAAGQGAGGPGARPPGPGGPRVWPCAWDRVGHSDCAYEKKPSGSYRFFTSARRAAAGP